MNPHEIDLLYHNLFAVYGTLRAGESNNHYFDRGHLLTTITLRGFIAYQTPYGFPCVITGDKDNDDHYVVCDVYALRNYYKKAYAMIDRLEGYNPLDEKSSLYIPEQIPLPKELVDYCEDPIAEDMTMKIYIWNGEIPEGSSRIHDFSAECGVNRK